MVSLIARILAWIARRLVLLFVIVGILVAVAWLKTERDRLEHDRQAIVDQEQLLESWQAELKTLDAQARAAESHWSEAQAQFETVRQTAADARATANQLRVGSRAARAREFLVGQVPRAPEVGRTRDQEA